MLLPWVLEVLYLTLVLSPPLESAQKGFPASAPPLGTRGYVPDTGPASTS
jgi:hypothetical protein